MTGFPALNLNSDGSIPIGHGKTLQSTGGTISSSGDNSLIAAVTSKRIKVYGYCFETISTTAVTLTIKDGNGGATLGVYTLQAPTGSPMGANLAVPPPAFLFGTTAGNLLDGNLSAAVSVTYTLFYFTDDAT